jgi:hypothetical protein
MSAKEEETLWQTLANQWRMFVTDGFLSPTIEKVGRAERKRRREERRSTQSVISKSARRLAQRSCRPANSQFPHPID